MRGVPPEVDQLMWAVSENPDPGAIAEFGERYPQLRAELMHRVNMVRSLRNEVKPGLQRRQELPRFQPREVASMPNPRGLVLAGGLALAALAAASYTAYSMLKPAPHRAPISLLPREDQSQAPIVPPVRYQNPPTVSPPPKEAIRQPERAVEVDKVPAYLRPRDVAVKDENLTTALAMITEGTGIKLVIGPGFVDQKVSVDYRSKTTAEILKDLADQYAFSVFDEGNGTYLVLPVPDRTAPPSGISKVDTSATK